MNEAELAKAIIESSGFTDAEAAKILKVIVRLITKHLKKDGKVKLTGFGIFEVRDRKERNGWNPMTREIIKIKACKSPVFVASAALKMAVL